MAISPINILLGEILGTMILVGGGNGVITKILFMNKKREDPGRLTGFKGFSGSLVLAVLASAKLSGGHLNPAVTIGLWTAGLCNVGHVPFYIIGQIIGAFLGQMLIYFFFFHQENQENQETKNMKLLQTLENTKRDQFLGNDFDKQKENQLDILQCFCTTSSHFNEMHDLAHEIFGTSILLFMIQVGAGRLPIFVFALYLAFILYSIFHLVGRFAYNPTRDLVPRLVHHYFLIKDKGDSDWKYAWIPIAGPIIGGILGCLLATICIIEFV
jgi:glycerol uptake facilitator protein